MHRFLPLVAVAAVGAVLGTCDCGRVGDVLQAYDGTTHAVGTGLLALALRHAFPSTPAVALLAACAAAALALEAVQAFVPGRTAAVSDVLAGLAGAAVVLALARSQARVEPTGA